MDKVVMGSGGSLIAIGIIIESPVIISAGTGVVVVMGIKKLYDVINIPNTAQNTANEIWNKTGLREHYEELDQTVKELGDTNRR